MHHPLVLTVLSLSLLPPLAGMAQKSPDYPYGRLQATLDLQGHRGCRGLMPENTLPAMRRALDLKVTTLELDVVTTGDRTMVVSHEPWMSAEIALDPGGRPIPPEQEKSYNIFQMTTADLARWDVGSKPHPRFPQQQKLKATKPTLTELLADAEAYARERGLPPPHYNIETKIQPDWDGKYTSSPAELADGVLQVVRQASVQERVTIQSFDPRTLQHLHRTAPEVKLVLLVENVDGLKKNLARLGFTPYAYSPAYQLVTKQLVAQCHKLGMRVVPWTVNELADMQRLVELGVDGLISDYPDRFSQLKP